MNCSSKRQWENLKNDPKMNYLLNCIKSYTRNTQSHFLHKDETSCLFL